MIMKKWGQILLLSLAITTLVLSTGIAYGAGQSGGNYVIPSDVLDSAGGSAVSTSYKVDSQSLGQPSPIGFSSGGDYMLGAGYLYSRLTVLPMNSTPDDGGGNKNPPANGGGGNSGNNNSGGSSGGDQPAPVDTEAPVNKSVNFIDNGKPSANGRSVTLRLLASDNVAVTAYLASESSSKPDSNHKDWSQLVTPAKNIQISVHFNLGKAPGKKTVHVWFKDVRGNVSDVGFDDIKLSKKALKSPVISSFSPKSGPAGATVTIRGENFSKNNSKKNKGKNVVRFNGKKGKVISVNKKGTLIKAVVPSGARTGPITVMLDRMTADSEDNFTVIKSGGDASTSGPKIKRFSPKSGKEGTTVTIFGKKFSPIKKKNKVKLGQVRAKVISANKKGTKIKIKVPKTAETGYITIKVGKNKARSKTRFLVK